MKKALLMAPMGSVHRRFNRANIVALKELGYEIHLLANFEEGEGTEKQNPEYVEKCKSEGIIIHSIPYQRHSLIKNLRLIGETRRFFKENHFDLVHAHTETGGLIFRASLKKAKKSRKFYTPHGMSFYKGSSLKTQLIYRPIERWICKKMDGNLTINQEEYQTVLKWKPSSAFLTHGIGLNVERIQSPSKTREEMRKELGLSQNDFVFLSIGELDDNKNHKTVIKALSKIDCESVIYLICGVGYKKDELENLANDLHVGNRVRLLGYRKDIPEIIGCCDAFVFPSFHEGLPVSLMEAMAGGLPTVCSDIRGNRDLIRDGENGYLFNPSNEEELKEKLSLIINDSKNNEKFSNLIKKEIIDYSEQKVIEELKVIYG